MRKPKKKKSNQEEPSSASGLMSNFFNNIAYSKNQCDEMLIMFNKINKMHDWGCSILDLPPVPNLFFLEGNELFLPFLYFEDTDEITGMQRTLDECLKVYDIDFVNNNIENNRFVVVKGKIDESSMVNEYKSGLRWVKFGIYRQNEFEQEVIDKNRRSFKRKAGLEMLMLFKYCPELEDLFIRYFGDIVLDDYDYILNDNGKEFNCQLCISREDCDEPAGIRLIVGDEIAVNICDFMVDVPLLQ